MISVLEFPMSHEYKHAWNISARACFYIYGNLDNSMFLYRYKLAYSTFIFNKFSFNNPDKINFDKLDGDSIFLFHLDTYQENTTDIRKLLDFCLEKDIDIYIPIVKIDSIKFKYPGQHIHQIKDILKEYDTNIYDFTNISYSNSSEVDDAIVNITKPLIRNIKMRRLLD
jgi:hypothetical protein